MAALARLILIAAAAALVYYVIIRPIVARGRQRQRTAPLCQRCERGRSVIANTGADPKFPKHEYAWYCKDCREGF